jgi:DNA-binding transcriptional LysR family regulator
VVENREHPKPDDEPGCTASHPQSSSARNIELRHLRYFVAVAEEASFAGAARRVHVAQQVLSAQVRQLEDSLGVQLLRRTTRGVTLTPSGGAFLEGARETLSRLERAQAAARNLGGAVAGQLRVGINAGCGEAARRILHNFERAYPQVEISLRSFDMTHPAGGLLDCSTDVAFVWLPVDAPGLELRRLEAESRMLMLPDTHPFAERDSVDLAETFAFPWIAFDLAVDGCEPAAWRNDWLPVKRPDGTRPVIGAVARNVDEYREHVLAGHGIGLVPASTLEYCPRPGLAFIPSRGADPACQCAAWRANDLNPLVARFAEMVTTRLPYHS